MKKLFTILAFMPSFFSVTAQVSPQFVYQPTTAQVNTFTVLSYHEGSKDQSMYRPSEFPGMQAGSITAVYLRSFVKRTTPISFRNMTVKMGHIPVNESGATPDTIPHSILPMQFFPCATVFYASSFTVPTPIDSGDWIKFTLQTPFQYNGTTNFVVEFSQDSGSTLPTPLPNLKTIAYAKSLRTYVSHMYPPWSGSWQPVATEAYINLIGLDMAPNGVNDLEGKRGISVYPNPAKDILSIAGIEQASYQITDVTGKALQKGNYSGTNISIASLPPGMYFIRLTAEGRQQTLKFIKQ